jgi:hypothetical protein
MQPVLLRSSRTAEAISKEAFGGALLKGVKSVGKGLLGAGQAAAPTALKAGKWAVKNPMKAIGIGGGAAIAGGAGLAAAKGVVKSMQTPTPQALMKRRMEGFRSDQ